MPQSLEDLRENCVKNTIMLASQISTLLKSSREPAVLKASEIKSKVGLIMGFILVNEAIVSNIVRRYASEATEKYAKAREELSLIRRQKDLVTDKAKQILINSTRGNDLLEVAYYARTQVDAHIERFKSIEKIEREKLTFSDLLRMGESIAWVEAGSCLAEHALEQAQQTRPPQNIESLQSTVNYIESASDPIPFLKNLSSLANCVIDLPLAELKKAQEALMAEKVVGRFSYKKLFELSIRELIRVSAIAGLTGGLVRALGIRLAQWVGQRLGYAALATTPVTASVVGAVSMVVALVVLYNAAKKAYAHQCKGSRQSEIEAFVKPIAEKSMRDDNTPDHTETNQRATV